MTTDALVQLCYDEMERRHAQTYLCSVAWSVGEMLYGMTHKSGKYPIEPYKSPIADIIKKQDRNSDNRSSDELIDSVLKGL